MEENKLVSIVMTAYNAEAYLKVAMESVLNQTYPNIELVVINDASTDKTLEIAQSYADKDARITIVNLAKNKGVSGAANEGIKAAKGFYIARLDSDDIMKPNRIETQVKFLQENPKVTMTSSDSEIINQKGKIVGNRRAAKFDKIEDSENTYKNGGLVYCYHTGFMTYKSVYEEVGGYNEQLSCMVDTDIFTRMVEKGHKLIILHQNLVQYRIHGTSTVAKTSKNLKYQQTHEYLLDCARRRKEKQPLLTLNEFSELQAKDGFFTKLKRKRDAYAHAYLRAAQESYASANYFKTAYYVMLGIILEPSRLGKRFINQLKRRLKR